MSENHRKISTIYINTILIGARSALRRKVRIISNQNYIVGNLETILISQTVVLKKFTCSARFALQKGIFKGKYAPQARKFWYLSVEKTDFKGEMCAAGEIFGVSGVQI